MKYIISSLIVCFVILFACNSSKQASLFSTDNLETEQFIVNTERDTVLQTSKGAFLKIPKGALVSADGKPVKLDIKEAYSMSDIIKAGLTTTSNGEPLSSGGMIYINAADGQEVTIKEGIQVALPSNNLSDSMKLYKGETTDDGKINWVEPKDLPENKQIAAVNRGKQLYLQSCTSCHAIETKVVGPPLAHFLKKFPLPEDPAEKYWGYMAHPPFYIAEEKAIDTATTKPVLKIKGTEPDTGSINHDIKIQEPKTDSIKKRNELLKSVRQLIKECNLGAYAHLMEVYAPTQGQAFKLSKDDLNKIYKYIQNESDRLGLPAPEHEVFPDDCIDSCITYVQRVQLLWEAKSIQEDKRQQFIEENGEMTVVVPDPTWRQGPGTGGGRNNNTPDFEDKVSPNNFQATYYQFTVETFGWYNIDVLLDELGEKVKNSELLVKLAGEWTDRVNIFLIIPSYNVYGEGGPSSINPAAYAFFNRNGTIPLPQNEKAFILAVSEKDDKIGYAIKEFRTELKQELEVVIKESTKEEFDKAIASMGATRMNVAVKPSINADSIRAADKQLKDIDKGIKDAEILKPKNCNCECWGEGSGYYFEYVDGKK
jgi:cytochrome c2